VPDNDKLAGERRNPEIGMSKTIDDDPEGLVKVGSCRFNLVFAIGTLLKDECAFRGQPGPGQTQVIDFMGRIGRLDGKRSADWSR
jgi:hypothetical protein